MDVWHAMLDMVLSALLTGAIGLEREWHNKAAGFRTHVLVGVGTTLLTLLSMHGFPWGDPTRVAAQVVTGIGFIGAGVILHRGYLVRGLTTASTLWVVMAIGMAVGVDWYAISAIATLLALGSLRLLTTFSDRLPIPARHRVRLEISMPPDTSLTVLERLRRENAYTRRGDWMLTPEGAQARLAVTLPTLSDDALLQLLDDLRGLGAQTITWNTSLDDEMG